MAVTTVGVLSPLSYAPPTMSRHAFNLALLSEAHARGSAVEAFDYTKAAVEHALHAHVPNRRMACILARELTAHTPMYSEFPKTFNPYEPAETTLRISVALEVPWAPEIRGHTNLPETMLAYFDHIVLWPGSPVVCNDPKVSSLAPFQRLDQAQESARALFDILAPATRLHYTPDDTAEQEQKVCVCTREKQGNPGVPLDRPNTRCPRHRRLGYNLDYFATQLWYHDDSDVG